MGINCLYLINNMFNKEYIEYKYIRKIIIISYSAFEMCKDGNYNKCNEQNSFNLINI